MKTKIIHRVVYDHISNTLCHQTNFLNVQLSSLPELISCKKCLKKLK